jgi:hypothetical protein
VADSSFAVLELLKRISGLPNVSVITRLRLDAQLWEAAPARRAGQRGRPRLKGARRPSPQRRLDDPTTPWTTLEVEQWYGGTQRKVEVYSETALWYKTGHQPVPMRWVLIRDPHGKFAPQALLSTHLAHTPQQILQWFVRRWRMEVTFEEARAHLGVETQRQWNDLGIARATPVVLGLFSLVTLLADRLCTAPGQFVRAAAWYTKLRPTFADAIALVRQCLWRHSHFSTSSPESDLLTIPRALFDRFTEVVCYAA